MDFKKLLKKAKKEEARETSSLEEETISSSENVDSNIRFFKEKPISFLLFSFVSLSFTFLASESFFKAIHYGFTIDVSILRIAFFSLGSAGILACFLSLLPLKLARILNTILCFIAAVYAFFQLGIYNMMHSFTTVKTAGGMAGAMTGYVIQYIKQVPIGYWFLLLIPILYVVVARKMNIEKSSSKKLLILVLVVAIALDSGGILLQYFYGNWDQYIYPTYQETAIREFGIERFLLRDIATIFSEKDTSLEEIEEEEVTTVDASNVREIDDTKWKELSKNDTDSDRQKVDSYLMNRTIDGYNDKTGLLEGKNLIYIMVEAFDYIAIDEELTPTLYTMKEEGWDFENHYTPKFDTGTSDSELISEVSLVPRMDMGVYNEFSTNDWSSSIFSIFKAQGYSTHAYHNWIDQYYPRHEMMESMYCEDYQDFEDMDYTLLYGWQSDYELFTLTVDNYIDEDQFMTMYITSSTHFPYDRDDDLSLKYLDEINEVHPDYPEEVKYYLSKAMELDRGLQYLIRRLKQARKFNDTAIVLFADHHPLNIDFDYIVEYTEDIDREEGMNEFRSPLIMYCPSILGDETFTGVSSTYSILPTILNLYNMDYDPRLYLGSDYFSDSESIVYFPDGDWLTNIGIYYASTGKFVSTTDEDVSESYIRRNTSKTNNAVNISYLIYTTDYFHYRSEITTPDDSKAIETSTPLQEENIQE